MRRIHGVLIASLAFWIGASACGQERLPPKALADKGKRPVSTIRYFDIPHELPNNRGRSGQVCRVRFVDPYFGYLSDQDYRVELKEPVSMQCYDADAPNMHPEFPVRYDAERKQWMRDDSHALDGWLPQNPEEANRLRRSIIRSTQVFNLVSVNATGYAYTQEQFTGEESTRIRLLDFCLIREPRMLCGHGEVGLLRDGPRGDLTPYILEVLRSVAFLDDAAAAPQPAVAASASASNAGR